MNLDARPEARNKRIANGGSMKISSGLVAFIVACVLMFAVAALRAFAVPYDPGFPQ